MSSARRVSSASLIHVPSAPEVSEALSHACAGFGVIPATRTNMRARHTRPSGSLLQQIRPGSVSLIVGASGSGKSSLMRGLRASLRRDRVRVVPESLSASQLRRASFDLLGGEMIDRARSLSNAGLAEPKLWALPAGSLSVGERARLRLAMTMHGSRPGDIVLADELASSIDRASAYALCRTITRWVQRRKIAFVGASAHEDLESMLSPDRVFEACTGTLRPARGRHTQPVRIETGTARDYHALGHLHYRSGAPATIVRVLRAMREVPVWVDPRGEMLAGVLVVSMPTLNSAWRDRAWAGFFRTGDKRRDARRLNACIRTISRVIVEPRSRGLGISTRLVRAYLRDPLTSGTEANAAMGGICPFFERAGMTRYVLGPDMGDTRLLDALSHLRIAPAQLAHTTIEPGSLLMREMTTWGKHRKLLPPGSVSREEVQRLTPFAACRLCSRPRAYAFTKGERNDDEFET